MFIPEAVGDSPARSYGVITNLILAEPLDVLKSRHAIHIVPVLPYQRSKSAPARPNLLEISLQSGDVSEPPKHSRNSTGGGVFYYIAVKYDGCGFSAIKTKYVALAGSGLARVASSRT
ncbi:MAG: hypothetical protein O3B21_16580 [Proteobacteria bacterium]|nr:hypothetical protein [Pseudomonadota bacterium]MDA1356406.1 hypothetical protein [Pseudomonadota bacterium]